MKKEQSLLLGDSMEVVRLCPTQYLAVCNVSISVYILLTVLRSDGLRDLVAAGFPSAR